MHAMIIINNVIIMCICDRQSIKSGIVHNARALCTMPGFRGRSWNKFTLAGHYSECPTRFGHCRLNTENIKN